jgi:hypothetical protein
LEETVEVRLFNIGVILSVLSLFLSCQSTDKFQRSSPVNPGSDQFHSTCSANDKASTGVFESHGFADTRLKIQGQFCRLGLEKQIANPVHVVHIVDYSGSMRDIDQVSQSSCSRLKAAQAFTDKFRPKDMSIQEAPIYVSVIGLGSFGVVRFEKVPLAQLSSNHMSAENFCKIELGDRAGTNYEYAFKEAHKILAKDTSDTRQEILFVSDGLPTVYGDSALSVRVRPSGSDTAVQHYTTAKNRGLDSAAQLRTQFQGSRLYIGVLELKDDANSAIWQQVIPDVRAFFVELAGGISEHVKMVSQSADLAKEIDVIQIEHGLANDQGALRAVLSADGFPARELQAKVIGHDTSTQSYTYEIDLVPFTRPGQIVENTLRVFARTLQGEEFISESRVRFNSR